MGTGGFRIVWAMAKACSGHKFLVLLTAQDGRRPQLTHLWQVDVDVNDTGPTTYPHVHLWGAPLRLNAAHGQVFIMAIG